MLSSTSEGDFFPRDIENSPNPLGSETINKIYSKMNFGAFNFFLT
jgi:hypothetical protein